MGPDKVLDVRDVACAIKHGVIVRIWLEVPVGDYFILLNHRDPLPLFEQFSEHWGGAFTWELLVKKPGEVRIKITKLRLVAPVEAVLECGGHHHEHG